MKTKGFTLVEAMIVIAIIGLLFAIAIPSFMQARKRRGGGWNSGRGWVGQTYSSPTESTTNK